MRVFWSLPWAGLVLAAPALAVAQVTVNDGSGQPAGTRPNIRAGTTITLGQRGQAVSSSEDHALSIPEFHTVSTGDTLWDISGYYFENPWRWPQVWARNPQITNPHWIFPGDQVRLLLPGEVTAVPSDRLGPVPASRLGGQFRLRSSMYPRGTAFLREAAWASPEEIEAAGTIAGSPEDTMMLSEGDQAYIEFFHRAPNIGESYTIYQEGQPTRGSDRDAGRVVRVLGTAVIDAWDPQRKVATARITESIDPIERGERVAFIQRQFLPVPPAIAERDMAAHVVATPTPREIVGTQYVVILDRGTRDGVNLGNRFFVVRRGDPWLTTTHASGMPSQTPIDRDGDGHMDAPPDAPRTPPQNLPAEYTGEMLVVSVHPTTCVCLVTMTSNEIEIGDPVVMRHGY